LLFQVVQMLVAEALTWKLELLHPTRLLLSTWQLQSSLLPEERLDGSQQQVKQGGWEVWVPLHPPLALHQPLPLPGATAGHRH
jgi:hypothetical protein